VLGPTPGKSSMLNGPSAISLQLLWHNKMLNAHI
jgi:hypothetical protein